MLSFDFLQQLDSCGLFACDLMEEIGLDMFLPPVCLFIKTSLFDLYIGSRSLRLPETDVYSGYVRLTTQGPGHYTDYLSMACNHIGVDDQGCKSVSDGYYHSVTFG